MKGNVISICVIFVSASMLSGCGIYEKYQTPTASALTAEYAEALASPIDSTAFGNLPWEDVFTDTVLAKYISIALENNTSLKNAKSNIDIAQAQLQGARMSYLPSLMFTPNGGGASYAGNALSWTYSVPLAASWEVDIFGKNLNSKRSAQEALYRSEAYAQAVRSQLIASVANCYYAIACSERQIELYRSTALLWEKSVQTMKDMKEAGRTTEAAVVQTTANYYHIVGGITDLEINLNKLYTTFSLLLHTQPRQWDIPADAALSIPTALQEGVHISILAHRPDVAAAEHSLAMAYYGTNSARAAFYPSLTLSVQGGFTNLLGSFIKNPGEWFYQLGASLITPIFARGQNTARLKVAKQQQVQALNNFEETLLSAAGEVNNALIAYGKAVEKSTSIVREIDNLERSVDYTNDLLLYSNGTYLEVINAQQSLLSAQMAEINNRLDIYQSIIYLYQSLGGGR